MEMQSAVVSQMEVRVGFPSNLQRPMTQMTETGSTKSKKPQLLQNTLIKERMLSFTDESESLRLPDQREGSLQEINSPAEDKADPPRFSNNSNEIIQVMQRKEGSNQIVNLRTKHPFPLPQD
jgi:hypothetical protein